MSESEDESERNNSARSHDEENDKHSSEPAASESDDDDDKSDGPTQPVITISSSSTPPGPTVSSSETELSTVVDEFDTGDGVGDEIQWDWALVLPIIHVTRHEGDDSGENGESVEEGNAEEKKENEDLAGVLEPLHRSLINKLQESFSPECVDFKRGRLRPELRCIRVRATQEYVEELAESFQFEMQTTPHSSTSDPLDINTDQPLPFSAKHKKNGWYLHPRCQCYQTHHILQTKKSSKSQSRPQSAKSDGSDDGTRSTGSKKSKKNHNKDDEKEEEKSSNPDPNICKCCATIEQEGECKCDLFMPYQRSDIIRQEIFWIVDGWIKNALAQVKAYRQRKLARLQSKENAEGNLVIMKEVSSMEKELSMLNLDLTNASWGEGLTLALRYGLLVDAFPMPTLNNPSAFYDDRYSVFEGQLTFSDGKFLLSSLSGKEDAFKLTTFMRGYFGEKIALLFVFLHFYNTWLVLLSVFGALLSLYSWARSDSDNALVPIFCIIGALWSTLFIEFWKRESCGVAHIWYIFKDFFFASKVILQ